jgi:hypothetical protein
VLEQPAVDLPRLAAVGGAEEHARSGAEVEVTVRARLDVPALLERQLGVLGQAEPLRALPALAEIVGALDGRAVDPVVGGDVDGAVARVADRVEDLPAGEQRPLELPLPAGFASAE